MTSSNLVTQHQQFPGLANKSYFNFGGQGPMPQGSLTAIAQAYETVQQQGPFSRRVNDWINQELHATRTAIATELGTSPETITLTENVTAGCNIPLWGIPWQVGDHILITDCEHPGVIAVLEELARRFGVTISTCPILETLNSGDPVAIIAQHLQPQTRLVVLSHILWNTGQVLPLTEIVQACQAHQGQHSVQVLVDAAQSVGVLPLNLPETGVDFYAFTGHKWCCGPAGVGGLYVKPAALETIAPTYGGWRGITMDEVGTPTGWKADGQRFEVATSAYPLLTGLQSAIALHQQWGTARDRYAQICQNSAYLWQGLSQLPQIECLRTAAPESGLVSFRVQTDTSNQKIVQTLEQQGFYVRNLLHPDCLRACVHYMTLPDEMDRLVEVLGTVGVG